MRLVQQVLRWSWSQLTSMRTALLLLFALALAAVPGAFIPQRRTDPLKVRDLTRIQPGLAKAYDALGLFDVYAAPWFAAIYLLLLVSLVGCIIPRTRAWLRSLRRPPVRVPTNLDRLPVHQTAVATAQPDVDAAVAWLRARRYRVAVTERGVSAERGYLREAGNIVFHLGLLAVLVGVGAGSLYGYRGTAVVPEKLGFSNSLTQYDDFAGGAQVTPASLQPFTLVVDDFDVTFKATPPSMGMPLDFHADVTVTDGSGATREQRLAVNEPVNVGPATVHLLGHGYAVDVVVRDAQGHVALSGPVNFIPQDGNFSSVGVIKAPDARPERLAFEGMFLPTGVVDAAGPHSVFPEALDPQLFLNAWSGPPKAEDGKPGNVYQLDKAGLTQISSGGKPLALRVRPGQTVTLPDGKGTLQVVGFRRWVKLQVSQTPFLPVTLGAFVVALTGLCLSLFVRPRRLFLRVSEDDGQTRVVAAGLDRAEGRAGLDDDVAALLSAATGTTSPTGPARSPETKENR